MNLCFCFMNDRIETILLIRTMEFFNNSNRQKDWLNNVAFAE
ncbi:Uncharacterized protein A9P81_1831 [Leptospira interrogans serovar Copenhageni/Icterohaemorrhagiae]|nr:Uncharacterized protein A9P81_1831 [Leptospira interrogans serovar Copenhageni/Icterohaemorrhagiae]OBZ99660.1 Uncharacterized protein A9P81_2269 [Leptospira interrogans serovar Copenhageni/Icterohaemorrhagiae]OCC29713.1 Uncharacterized protein GNX_1784 [Leptospira interrogans serovar Canicola]SIQ00702.1 hypothetical protein SAMN05421689_102166 [Leptospira interrogans]